MKWHKLSAVTSGPGWAHGWHMTASWGQNQGESRKLERPQQHRNQTGPAHQDTSHRPEEPHRILCVISLMPLQSTPGQALDVKLPTLGPMSQLLCEFWLPVRQQTGCSKCLGPSLAVRVLDGVLGAFLAQPQLAQTPEAWTSRWEICLPNF